eukprot:4155798-Amphidinium_carterae.1
MAKPQTAMATTAHPHCSRSGAKGTIRDGLAFRESARVHAPAHPLRDTMFYRLQVPRPLVENPRCFGARELREVLTAAPALHESVVEHYADMARPHCRGCWSSKATDHDVGQPVQCCQLSVGTDRYILNNRTQNKQMNSELDKEMTNPRLTMEIPKLQQKPLKMNNLIIKQSLSVAN